MHVIASLKQRPFTLRIAALAVAFGVIGIPAFFLFLIQDPVSEGASTRSASPSVVFVRRVPGHNSTLAHDEDTRSVQVKMFPLCASSHLLVSFQPPLQTSKQVPFLPTPPLV